MELGSSVIFFESRKLKPGEVVYIYGTAPDGGLGMVFIIINQCGNIVLHFNPHLMKIVLYATVLLEVVVVMRIDMEDYLLFI